MSAWQNQPSVAQLSNHSLPGADALFDPIGAGVFGHRSGCSAHSNPRSAVERARRPLLVAFRAILSGYCFCLGSTDEVVSEQVGFERFMVNLFK